MTSRLFVYAALAAWTVGVTVVTIYVLPDAADVAIGTVKTGFVVWVVGVSVLGGFIAWRDRDFFLD